MLRPNHLTILRSHVILQDGERRQSVHHFRLDNHGKCNGLDLHILVQGSGNTVAVKCMGKRHVTVKQRSTSEPHYSPFHNLNRQCRIHK